MGRRPAPPSARVVVASATMAPLPHRSCRLAPLALVRCLDRGRRRRTSGARAPSPASSTATASRVCASPAPARSSAPTPHETARSGVQMPRGAVRARRGRGRRRRRPRGAGGAGGAGGDPGGAGGATTTTTTTTTSSTSSSGTGGAAGKGELDLCASDAECGAALSCEPMWKGGPQRCTPACASDSGCPSGLRCTQAGAGKACTMSDVGKPCAAASACNFACFSGPGTARRPARRARTARTATGAWPSATPDGLEPRPPPTARQTTRPLASCRRRATRARSSWEDAP